MLADLGFFTLFSLPLPMPLPLLLASAHVLVLNLYLRPCLCPNSLYLSMSLPLHPTSTHAPVTSLYPYPCPCPYCIPPPLPLLSPFPCSIPYSVPPVLPPALCPSPYSIPLPSPPHLSGAEGHQVQPLFHAHVHIYFHGRRLIQRPFHVFASFFFVYNGAFYICSQLIGRFEFFYIYLSLSSLFASFMRLCMAVNFACQ